MSQAQRTSPKQSAEGRNVTVETVDAPGLRSMLSTDELRRRPSRPPDHAGGDRALVAWRRRSGDLARATSYRSSPRPP